MIIKCIIVDGQPVWVNRLNQLLANYPEVKVIETANNGVEALHKIQVLQPDLIFLDVELPDMNGFEMLKHCPVASFQTIFVHSEGHYAIQAIRSGALDYLLRPLNHEELALSLKRYRSQRTGPPKGIVNLKEQVLFLPTQDGGIRINLKDLLFVESERNYSKFHLINQSVKLSSKTLGYFERILIDKGFFRCHRSYLVNPFYVVEEVAGMLQLKNQQFIPISRRKRKETMIWLQRF